MRDMTTNNMLERIAKLLNQAENAGTEAEAAVFMEKAQQLATVHSIDLARARHATKDKERTVPVQRTIHIGERGSRGLRTITDLYLGIAAANDIRCTIAHDATRVYAVGFAEDIDISEALFASLQVQQASALDVFKKAGEWKNETVYHEAKSYWDSGTWKPQTWLTARLNFQDAYASRIRGRLHAAKWDEEERQRKLDEERAARPHLDDEGNVRPEFAIWLENNHGLTVDALDDDDAFGVEFSEMLRDLDDEWTQELLADYQSALDGSVNAGSALVLVEKRAAVAEAAAPAERRARGSYRGGTSGASSNSGRAAGRAAADRARLGGGTAIGGTRGAISA
jgi:hypothetical protein